MIPPFVEGLGEKAGPLVFQFTPLGREFTKDPSRFISRLHSGLEYEEAKDRYAPFDRLVDEDLKSREAIAGVSVKKARDGAEVIVIANNKAEGCAPESLRRLAEEIVRRAS